MFRSIKNHFYGVAVAFMVLLGAMPVNAMESFFGKKLSENDKKEFIKEISGIVSQALSTGLEQGLGNGLEKGIGKGLETGLGDGLTKGIGNGLGKAVDELFKNLNTNMSQGGNGQEAINKFMKNIVDSFGNQFNQGGGSVENTSNKIADFIDNFFANRFQESATNLGNNLGSAFDKVSGGLGNGLDSGIDKLGEGAGRGIDKLADKISDRIKSGSKIDKSSAAAVDLLNRRYNQAFNGVVVKSIVKTGGAAALSIALCVSGIYGTKVLWRHVERKIMRPKLIIDSSNKSILQRIKGVFSGKKEPVKMIFSPEVGARINTIIAATKNINQRIKDGKTNVKYRNVLLYGAPGTGKTMFAKKLAEESGLEWVLMSGSSFAKFKDGEAIEELDHLMQWAQRSKGLMIIIDECEAFLRTREKMKPGSPEYQLLNNFLNYTGERSNRFMLVMMTNHKNDIDSAMHRRIDDFIEIPLPGASERMQVLALYRDKILMDVNQNGQPFVGSVSRALNNQKLNEIAAATHGLSNGDLEGIINTIKTDADTTASGMVTTSLVDTAVRRAMEKYKAFGTQDKNNAIGYAIGAA